MVGPGSLLWAVHDASSSTTAGEAVVIGVASSFAASLVFLIVVPVFLRPKLKISTVIAKTSHAVTGKQVYRVKLVNKGMMKAVNVRIEMAILTRMPAVDGGFKDQRKNLDVRPVGFVILPRYVFSEQFRAKQRQESLFAFRVGVPPVVDGRPQEVEESLADPNRWIRIRVYAEHPLSRAVRSFEENYTTASCVKVGDFPIGKSLEVCS